MTYDPKAKLALEVHEVPFRRTARGRQLMARVYQPLGREKLPVLLDLHGGAWNNKDRFANETMDRVVAASGVLVVAVERHGIRHLVRPGIDGDRQVEPLELREHRLVELRDRPRPMPGIRFIVGERALAPPPRYEHLMPEQLEHLRKVIEEDNSIELCIIQSESIPLSSYLPFRLCSIESRWVAHLEHREGGVTKDDRDLITRLTTMFQGLSMESLPKRETLKRIKEEISKWNGESLLTAPTPGTASK
jgi:hypothetical protein